MLLSFSVAQAYKLDKKPDLSNFLSSFVFINGHDKYTGGCASYVSKNEAAFMGLARVVGNQVYLGVDNNSVIDVMPRGGRKSVRLESHDTIDSDIVIADFAHLPANACGMWPAFWLLHDDEFNGDFYAEIDIIESVSYLPRNEITLNTKPAQCTMAAGAIAPYGTFGDSLNRNGGGIWATQVEAEAIKIWYFTRSEILADITSDSPDPSKWGKSVVSLVPQKCDIGNAWKKMKLTFNITFCGESAGGKA
ncbi:hypothetical protein N0V86_000764 [Didymella sp. IMI 355093]|nr:hypothetical protein N0V86_000764 [Didymella sp. IMI 355093]